MLIHIQVDPFVSTSPQVESFRVVPTEPSHDNLICFFFCWSLLWSINPTNFSSQFLLSTASAISEISPSTTIFVEWFQLIWYLRQSCKEWVIAIQLSRWRGLYSDAIRGITSSSSIREGGEYSIIGRGASSTICKKVSRNSIRIGAIQLKVLPRQLFY